MSTGVARDVGYWSRDRVFCFDVPCACGNPNHSPTRLRLKPRREVEDLLRVVYGVGRLRVRGGRLFWHQSAVAVTAIALLEDSADAARA